LDNDLALIKEREAQLKAQLKISIWRDQGKIYGGQKWPIVLGEAIADQDILLLAWSKYAAASHFVEFEWCTAIALKKTIIPCLLDSTAMPPSLAATQGIFQISRSYGRAFVYRLGGLRYPPDRSASAWYGVKPNQRGTSMAASSIHNFGRTR
jgi:hypothetical protein